VAGLEGGRLVRVRLFVAPPGGANYQDYLRVARHAQELGFDGVFCADHYQPLGNHDTPRGATDVWTTLAGLARETTRIRLGTLVSSATFRHPGPLSVTATQVDQMSGGRLEVGLGAGWYEPEHAAYGIPFPPDAERLDRLEEQLQILLGLWSTGPGHRYSFRGAHYQLDGASPPQPTQKPHPPLIVGGRGKVRTPMLAARYADEYNISFRNPGETERQYRRVRAACDRAGRDTENAPLRLSATVVVACGCTSAEASSRARLMLAPNARPPEASIVGPPQAAVEHIQAYAVAGADTVYLNTVDLADLDHLDLIADQVLPHLSSRPATTVAAPPTGPAVHLT
jgi:F420-dependent oxidoreductase-like protein